jgi:iron complex outermembrane receptor protein
LRQETAVAARCVALFFSLFGFGVQANDKIYDLAIPSAATDSAIKELAKQTGMLTLFESNEVAHVQTKSIDGRFTVKQALDSMLDETPLSYDLTTGGVIVLRHDRRQELPIGGNDMSNDSAPKTDQRSGFRRFVSTLLATAVGAGGVAAAPAASAEQADALELIVEEIIVTAEKREESLLETPLTMSAFSEQMIEELGMTNALDLEQLVPGLQFGSAALQQRSDGQGITIRGIGTQSARELHSDLAVAVYVDGVYTVDTYGLAPNLFDIERVEVARGPQGTLNGRNSIAGAIHFHSKRPTFEWDTQVLAELTDQTTERFNVAFGGPLTENLAFRINAGRLTGDGSQENDGLGDDLGEPDQTTISPQLRFRTERFDVNLKYLKVEDEGSEENWVPFGEFDRTDPDNGNWYLSDVAVPSISGCSNPVTNVNLVPQPIDGDLICGDLENVVLSNRDGTQANETERWILNADWNITETLTLRYTFGDSETNTLASTDSDQTSRVGSAADPSIPADLDPSEVAVWTASGASFADGEVNHVFFNEEESHELQLISNFEGPFNFVAGYYSYENETFWEQGILDYANPLRFVDADEAAVAASPIFGLVAVDSCASYLDDFFLPFFGDPATRTAFGLNVECPVGMDHTKTASFFSATTSDTDAYFVNAEYELTEQWTIAGGLRRTEDEKVRRSRVPMDLPPSYGETGDGLIASGLFVGDFFGTGVPVSFILPSFPSGPESWDATIGHVSVEWTPQPQRMYYGRVSTGYRAGGFNFAGADIKNTFEEESLINYEVGMKGLFLDGRLQLIVGGFYQVFEDYQLTANQPVDPRFVLPTDESPLAEQTINVGDDTNIWGLEVEWIYQIDENWRVSGFYNYLDSELGSHSTIVRADPDQQFEQYQYTDPSSPGPDGVFGTADDFVAFNMVPIPRDHGGDELPQMPNHKAAVTLAYDRPLQIGGSLQLLTTVSYTGERWPQRAGNISRAEVPSYTRWDARATWESENRQWTASLYVQNILDDVGVSEAISIDLIGSLTEPRQVGLQLRWRPQFGG